jgi:CheY-like chemotaxis protein
MLDCATVSDGARVTRRCPEAAVLMAQPAQTPRVVLVEDDDSSRIALQSILQQAGFQVEAARDGGEGVQLVQTFHPDAVILDLVLPGLNGFEAATLLKNDTATADIPLIAVTASWLGSEGGRLRAIGFDTALRKPFPAAELVDELRRLLRH